MDCNFKSSVILYITLFYHLLVCVDTITTENMQIKRTRLEIIGTEKRYYNNMHQTESGYNSLWKIFLVSFIILILIIIFVMCYRYIYGQIIYVFKRCMTWRNKDNSDNSSPILKEIESDSCAKRQFFRSNICNFSTFRMKYDGQRNKQYENKYKLKTLLQEKKKLLAPRENKIVTSTNSIDLTKQLSLKMSFSSFSSTHSKYKNVPKLISNKWNIRDIKNYKCNELSNQSVGYFYNHPYQNGKGTSFSDTDLKFLVIPLFSKKADTQNNEQTLLYKWNFENVNNSKSQDSTSSKQIELKFENMDSCSDKSQKHKRYASKSNNSPYSLVTKDLDINSKYFSDTADTKSDILPNVSLNKLKRSTNSYTSSTLSDVSNTVKTRNYQMLRKNTKTENTSICTLGKINTDKRHRIKELKSPLSLNEHTTYPRKITSSIEISKREMQKIERPSTVFTSDKNLSNNPSIKTNSKNFSIKQIFLSASEQLIHNKENTFVGFKHKSEINETDDELGIFFSQYIKLQSRPCQRKYCALKRYLKQQLQHTTKKCQKKCIYYTYSYDQRPTCNSGNICLDTYDELKLMYSLPKERKNIYKCMFERRKHFLNQPCISSN